MATGERLPTMLSAGISSGEQPEATRGSLPAPLSIGRTIILALFLRFSYSSLHSGATGSGRAGDYRVQTAVALGIPLFSASDEAAEAMHTAGLPIGGALDDLVAGRDIVVACTPKKIASLNRDRYVAAGRKAIFQGGEKHALTGFSFVASLNYADATGRDLVRVVSSTQRRSAGSSVHSTGGSRADRPGGPFSARHGSLGEPSERTAQHDRRGDFDAKPPRPGPPDHPA